jgi:(p)ppGpp synthase/HD superfamily hydrolase
MTKSYINDWLDKLLIEAKRLAYEYHADQRRNDETPYTDHIEAVVAGVDDRPRTTPLDLAVLKNLQIVAYLHDIIEDTEFTASDLRAIFPSDICEAVILLTKVKDEKWNYVTYLDGIAKNYLAKRVKLSDLKHNMSDLKPGNLYDKYMLTVAYLNGK